MPLKKLTLKQINKQASNLQKCKNLEDVSNLLKVSKNEITLLSFEPLYYHFTIPKKNGGLRYIEAPELGLKSFQRKLNQYLQAIYFLNQTNSSFGYIIKPVAQQHTKGIYNNAKYHLGCQFMLNADFEDFFHQINIKEVTKIFKSNLFSFNNYTAFILAKICCFKEKLPMGAPTSPVLSNLYTIKLDCQLELWANNNNIKYSRYVDDLTFSSIKDDITSHHFNEIENITNTYNLKFNKSKTKFFKENNKKIVTGLILNKTVDIDPLYYYELDKDIERLNNVIELYTITGFSIKNIAVKTFKQELIGKINFISEIEGNTSEEYNLYLNKFIDAQTVEEHLVTRWMKFGNYE